MIVVAERFVAPQGIENFLQGERLISRSEPAAEFLGGHDPFLRISQLSGELDKQGKNLRRREHGQIIDGFFQPLVITGRIGGEKVELADPSDGGGMQETALPAPDPPQHAVPSMIDRNQERDFFRTSLM